MTPARARFVAAALLVAALALTAPAASAAVSLQRVLDNADPGAEVRLVRDDHVGPAYLWSPLVLRGPPPGVDMPPVRFLPPRGDEAAAPVLTVGVPGGEVVLDDIVFVNAGEALRVEAGLVHLRGVGFRNVTTPVWVAENATVLFSPGPPGGQPSQPPPVAGAGVMLLGRPTPIHVHTASGEPVPGARVRLEDAEGRNVTEWRVGPQGVLQAFSPHARRTASGPDVDVTGYSYRVTAPGYATVLIPVSAAREDGPTVVTLTALADLAALPLAPAADAPAFPAREAAAVAAGVAAVGAVGLAFRLLRDENRLWRLLLFLAPLYTRLARGELLDQPQREAVYRHVQAHPGAHYREVQRALALPNGVLAHHLNLLVREGYVREERSGMYRRFSAVGSEPLPASPEAGEALLAFLRRHPGITAKEAALGLHRSPSLIAYHVKRLEAAGRLERRRQGREVALYVVEPVTGARGSSAARRP